MEEKKKKSKLMIIIPIVVVVIIAIVVIGFIAFTNNTMSKEKMLEIAQDYTGRNERNVYKTNDYFLGLANNMANAENQKGNIFKMQGIVDNIEKDYCEFVYGSTKIRMYLATEELSTLKKDENVICVVGKLKDVKKEDAEFTANFNKYDTIFEFKNCYLVEKEDTGTSKGTTNNKTFEDLQKEYRETKNIIGY